MKPEQGGREKSREQGCAVVHALVLPCGGVGARMAASQPKQFLALDGVSIVARTLEAMAVAPWFAGCVLVLPRDHVGAFGTAIPPCPWPVTLVAGGVTRQDSVARGLAALPDGTTHVWVHDGVRPFVDAALLGRLREAVEAGRGAIVCAVPETCTLKRVGADSRVEETVDRSGIWQVQTPQVFRLDWLSRGLDTAARDGVSATDDAALVERLGLPVHVVEGNPENLKITTPADLKLAEAIYRTKHATLVANP